MRKFHHVFALTLVALLAFTPSSLARSVTMSAPLYDSPGATVPIIVSVSDVPRGYVANFRVSTHEGRAFCDGKSWRWSGHISRKCYLQLPHRRGAFHMNANILLTKQGSINIIVTGRNARAVQAKGYGSYGSVTLTNIRQIESCHNTTDYVWLTFDDAASSAQLRTILTQLDRYNVRGRFFFTGIWKRGNPSLLRLIKREGHYVANHSSTHAPLSLRSASEVRREIREGVLPTTTPKLLRPPYAAGALSNRLIALARGQGHKVCRWTVDTYDWQSPSTATMVSRIKYGDMMTAPIYKGGNILMHGTGQNTASSVDDIIRAVRSRNLQLEPLRSSG